MIEDKVIFEKSTVKGWGDAIRAKKGTTEEFPASQLAQEILSIETVENLDTELTEQENALGELETEIESLGDKEPSVNKLALLVGTQDATNNPYEITASDLDGVTEIVKYAFRERNGLTSIALPNTCTKIEGYAFYKCISLDSANIPSVTMIVGYAFEACKALNYVNMPKVETIGNRVFQECTALTSANMPNVTYIEERGFYGCAGLTSVNMPKVETIGNYAFQNCSSLTFLKIPATCRSISAQALHCGTSTNKCVIRVERHTPPQIGSNTIDWSRVERVEVNIGDGETYKTATNWAVGADKIVEVDF